MLAPPTNNSRHFLLTDKSLHLLDLLIGSDMSPWQGTPNMPNPFEASRFPKSSEDAGRTPLWHMCVNSKWFLIGFNDNQERCRYTAEMHLQRSMKIGCVSFMATANFLPDSARALLSVSHSKSVRVDHRKRLAVLPADGKTWLSVSKHHVKQLKMAVEAGK